MILDFSKEADCMEVMENWKEFLNKKVNIIVDDPPSPYPKSKEGILIDVTPTHLILQRNDKTEALRITDIRRVELKRGEE